jgi:hypothetical protein
MRMGHSCIGGQVSDLLRQNHRLDELRFERMAITRSTAFWTVFFLVLAFLVGVPTCVHFSFRHQDRINSHNIWASRASGLVLPIGDLILKDPKYPDGVDVDRVIRDFVAQNPDYKMGDGPACTLFAPDAKIWSTSEVVCVSAVPFKVPHSDTPTFRAVDGAMGAHFIEATERPKWTDRAIPVSFVKPLWRNRPLLRRGLRKLLTRLAQIRSSFAARKRRSATGCHSVSRAVARPISPASAPCT